MKGFLSLSLVVAVILLQASATYPLTMPFTADLNGASQNPANASTGTGEATVTIDTDAHTMLVKVTFTDLLGLVTASHIHCCTSPPGNIGVATPVPTFPGFPLGVTSGTYSRLFDLTLATSYNPSFVNAHGGMIPSAEAALVTGIEAGRAYLNIHTNQFPGGEIRGFLHSVPEPSSLLLLGAGLAGVGILRRRFRK